MELTGVLFQRCFLGIGVDRVMFGEKTSVEETPVAMHGVATLAQYQLYSYMSICDFGVPCDCSQKSSITSGQCGEERLFLDFEQLQTHLFSAVSRHIQAVSRHQHPRLFDGIEISISYRKSSVRKSEIALSCTLGGYRVRSRLRLVLLIRGLC